MLIWRGLGFVFPLILFSTWGILHYFLNDVDFTAKIAIILAGIASSIIGFRANSKHQDNPHVLFMMPLQIGGLVAAILGTVLIAF